MKPNDLDDALIQLLDSAIHSGDCAILFDSFNRENTYLEKQDSIFLKLAEDLNDFSNDLPSADVLVSNSLQILTELIQAFGINETLCVYLARTVLLLIIDEKCSISNIKRAIHAFNLLLQNPSVINAIVTDESLEGAVQIFGRKIPDIGDYECQALLFEALYRITCGENRECWAGIWFSDVTAKNMFLNLDPLKFEVNCRKALNYINRNEPQRRVFSFIAQHVSFGSFQLKEPYGCEFWVDFNYDSQCISFYCSELNDDKALDDSALWETIVINSSSVKSYFLKDKVAEKTKEVILLLNCPCHTLVTSSIMNPAFNNYEITISFWGILNIRQHLEKIYGKDKYTDDVPLSQNRKVSSVSDVIQVVNELSDAWTNQGISQRKISSSVPISVDTFENDNEAIFPQKSSQKVNGEMPAYSQRKISYSALNLKIESDDGHQVTKSKPKRKQKGERSWRKGAVTSLSLTKSENGIGLESETIEKKEANIKAQSSSRFSLTKSVKKSSISATLQIDCFEVEVSHKNETVISNGHVDHTGNSVPTNINNREKPDEITDQNNAINESCCFEKTSLTPIVVLTDVVKSPQAEKKDYKNITLKKDNETISPLKKEVPTDLLKEATQSQRNMHAILQNSNTIPNSYERINEDISACSKRKTSYSIDSKNDEEEEFQVTEQRKKKKRRKMMKRKVKVSQTSSLSDNANDEISNIAKLRKNQANVEKENSLKSNPNKPLKKFSMCTQIQISNCDSDVLKNNPNNVISDEHVDYLNDNHSIISNDEKKVEKNRMETYKGKNVVLAYRDFNPMVIEDSLNGNYINFDQVTENKENMSPQEKHEICTILKQDTFKTKDNIIEVNNNNENLEVFKESGESSRETNNSETASKSHIKKVRLYNLESAPVYDVPPSSPNKFSTEIQNSNKKNSKIDGEHSDSSATTMFNTILHEKRVSEDLRHCHSSRKGNPNSTEDSTEKTSKGLDDQIKIYDVIPESDDDFEESANSRFRRKRKSATISSVSKEDSTKKRKYEASRSYSSQANQNERSVRKPRQAAVKAMKVNRRILDLTSEIACDKIEVLDESDDVSPTPATHKKKRLSKVFSSGQTDTETGSSEVSWLKKKSCPLFESPKKNYSGWKKTPCRQRVAPNANSSRRKSQKRRRKKTVSINKSMESGSKSKSAGWSDLEKFNLTVEKGRGNSHYIMKTLENDLQSISTNTRRKSLSKKSYSNQNIHELNSYINDNVQPNDIVEEHKLYKEHHESNIDYNNVTDNIQVIDPKINNLENDEQDYHHEISEEKEITREKFSSSNSKSSNDLQKNHTNTGSSVVQRTELKTESAGRKETQSRKKIHCENEGTSELVADKGTFADILDETKGKQFHLERFLECAVKCSESCLDSNKSSNNLDELSSYLTLQQPSNTKFGKPFKRKSDFTVQRNKSKKKRETINTKQDNNVGNEIEYVYESEENSPSMPGENQYRDQNKRIKKSKPNELSTSLKPKEHELHSFKRPSVRSFNLKDITLDCLSLRHSTDPLSNEKHHKSVDMHDAIDKTAQIDHESKSVEHNKSESSCRMIEHDKSKDNNESFCTLFSNVTTISLEEIKKSKKWFNEIIFTLSKDSNTLTRKLLATVQKCFFVYSSKMIILRENIVKVAEALEVPSSQNLNPSKLKNLIKSCSIVRKEVENTLKKMQVMGKEYFEAEEKHYRKLAQKQIKANEKYILNMMKSKKRAIHKLEGNIILKTKYFFRKFLKHINAA